AERALEQGWHATDAIGLRLRQELRLAVVAEPKERHREARRRSTGVQVEHVSRDGRANLRHAILRGWANSRSRSATFTLAPDGRPMRPARSTRYAGSCLSPTASSTAAGAVCPR